MLIQISSVLGKHEIVNPVALTYICTDPEHWPL